MGEITMLGCTKIPFLKVAALLSAAVSRPGASFSYKNVAKKANLNERE